MPLFGPPDVAKLDAKRDVLGLIKALGYQKDPRVRGDAAEALGRSGDPRAVEPLLAALKDADSDIRQRAAAALATAGDPSAVEQLLPALEDEDHSVRAAAARALGQPGDARPIEPLLAALKDGYAAVREAAAGALARIGAPAIEPLIAALRDPDGALRKGASEALVGMGGPAVEPLVRALADPQLRSVAGPMVGQIGDLRAVPLLVACLEDASDPVRKAAADTLDLLAWSPDRDEVGAAYWAAKGQWHKCVEVGAPAVEVLIGALKHHDSLVRQLAARGLGEIGDARAVEPLIGALRGREDVRAAAAVGLGQIDDARALEPLMGSLKDAGSNVRAAAARALGQMGDPRAVDRLIGCLKDHESIVRQAAAGALGEIGDARAVEPLIGLLKSREDVRAAAAAALGEIGDAQAIEPLIGSLKDLRTCVPAAEALARIGAPAVPPLVATLGDPNEVVRNAAVQALLVQIGGPAVKPLVAALGDARAGMREAAANALDRLAWTPGSGEAGAAYWAARGRWELCVQIGVLAVAPLVVAARTWEPSDSRVAAAWALGIIADPLAVEPLCAALNDKDAGVREAAAHSLGGIGDVRAVEPLIAAVKDRIVVVRRAAVGALERMDDPRSVRALEAARRKAAKPAPVATSSVGSAATSPVAAGPSTATSTVDSAPAAPTIAPARVWAPTHLVPPAGMSAWDAPDPSRAPLWQLAGNLELVVDATAGAWGRVHAVNGWWGWVDGRLLVYRS
jgi:HEAT repeat protein